MQQPAQPFPGTSYFTFVRPQPHPVSFPLACLSCARADSRSRLSSQCALLVYGTPNPAAVNFTGVPSIAYRAPAFASTYWTTGGSAASVAAPTQARAPRRAAPGGHSGGSETWGPL